MIMVHEKVHATDLKRPRALGPKWRVEGAYLVECVGERCVMVYSRESLLGD